MYRETFVHFIFLRHLLGLYWTGLNSAQRFFIFSYFSFVFRLDAFSVERNSYGNVSGWVAGWLGVRHTPVLYQKRLNLSENFFDRLKAPSL